MRIGVDLMGSDTPPHVLLAAALDVLQQSQQVRIYLYGTESELRCLRDEFETDLASADVSRLTDVVCSQVLTMDDSPLAAVRQKKDSSLMRGVFDLRDGDLDAFVSPGNTGALIASARLFLELFPGMERPALLASLPTEKGSVSVLDVGGNVSCKPEHLIQFAHLGAAYRLCSQGQQVSKVGLLNIGEESSKGTSGVRDAHSALTESFSAAAESRIRFVGNVEGREVYKGAVDVLLTDGFTGNIFLKASEGVSSFILEHLEDAFALNSAPEVQAVLRNLRRNVNYAEYPGAIVCGVDGVLVKCHGASSQRAVENAIKGAEQLVENGLVQQMKRQLTISSH